MNILGISGEGVEGLGLMLTMSTYLRWMDVGDISEKDFNESEDILEKDYDDKKDIFENVLDEGVDILKNVADDPVDISAKVLMKFGWCIY